MQQRVSSTLLLQLVEVEASLSTLDNEIVLCSSDGCFG